MVLLDLAIGFVVGALSVAMKDRNPKVRSCAVMSLGKTGAGAKSAVPALSGALKDPDRWVRTYAAEALIKIDRDGR